MRRKLFTSSLFLIIFLSCTSVSQTTSPLTGLCERISPGLSQKIIFTIDSLAPDSTDYYIITQRGDKPCIEANNYISAAAGLNHYLKYVAGAHVAWNRPTITLPEKLPAVADTLRDSTHLHHRYYLNYCTHSYSMAFWDWERWQQEIDFMALHGLNMPLITTGTEAVWRNTLRRLNYPDDKIDAFIAGPGFQAWWLMNNLEGWGGPNDDDYYDRNVALGRKILAEMRQWGMQPVLPGYSGMMPHDAASTLGIDVTDQGLWLGYTRPAFLQPLSSDFTRVAAIYYDEQQKLFGKAPFYSMDPFHEGGSVKGLDLDASGRAIYQAMKTHAPEAAWVIQAWQENPRTDLLSSLPPDSTIILDLQSESASVMPQRHRQLHNRPWLFCMLHNFGGNIGLYGKMQSMLHNFHAMSDSIPCLAGIGLTMEGIDNNSVVYELIAELPWRNITDPLLWVTDYATARYGTPNHDAAQAWHILASSVYNSPADSIQQGTCESLFCARPSEHPRNASSWANAKQYYRHSDVRQAARLMLHAADSLASNPNFRYDLVDIVRQTIADRGRETIDSLYQASVNGDSTAYRRHAERFMTLISAQNRLLDTHPEFRLSNKIAQARACGITPSEKDRHEWNMRTQISVWGHRDAADKGGLHDYAHREWSGMLSTLYAPRWQQWFDYKLANWNNPDAPAPDFFAMEEQWASRTSPDITTDNNEGDVINTARTIFYQLID